MVVSSTSARVRRFGREGRIAYGGSKAAVASMTRSLALEVARDGITVNCVAPGPVETELFLQNHPHGSPERQKIAGAIPVQRIGTTQEIAGGLCVFPVRPGGLHHGPSAVRVRRPVDRFGLR
jgi:NAD(P)-dependent dehydrogenase (short-subunit alcohol dehydrogenase family)